MSDRLFQTVHRPIYGRGQVVAYTGTAGVTTALPPGTTVVIVTCTTAAHVRVGTGPALAATVADLMVPANVQVPLSVELPTSPGSEAGIFVSAVQVSSGGNLHAMPCAD